jgi:phosphatidylinositol alpha-1,6-mannosyltransferase
MLSAERYKGHDQLLEAWPAVLARVPNARLVVVGDGDDVVRLQEKAAALRLSPNVVFTGFLSNTDLLLRYRQAAVFAMPSRSEGFGLVYLEAMAHRLPCIGSSHDAAGEVIEDGSTGYLVSQSDTTTLAARIVSLLEDEGLRRAMGERGHARLLRAYTYERFRDRFLPAILSSFGAIDSSPSRRRRLRTDSSSDLT